MSVRAPARPGSFDGSRRSRTASLYRRAAALPEHHGHEDLPFPAAVLIRGWDREWSSSLATSVNVTSCRRGRRRLSPDTRRRMGTFALVSCGDPFSGIARLGRMPAAGVGGRRHRRVVREERPRAARSPNAVSFEGRVPISGGNPSSTLLRGAGPRALRLHRPRRPPGSLLPRTSRHRLICGAAPRLLGGPG
jgi:hypothetical protein